MGDRVPLNMTNIPTKFPGEIKIFLEIFNYYSPNPLCYSILFLARKRWEMRRYTKMLFKKKGERGGGVKFHYFLKHIIVKRWELKLKLFLVVS